MSGSRRFRRKSGSARHIGRTARCRMPSAHAGSVEARRRRDAGVAATELARQVVELGERGVHAAHLHGQRVRGVVTGVHEQAVQDVADRVVPALADADLRSLCGRVVRGARDHLVDRQISQRLHGHEHLDDAGGPVPAVRILGGDDVAGVEVGDQPGLRGNVIGQRRCPRRGDDAAARRGRHRRRGRTARPTAAADRPPSAPRRRRRRAGCCSDTGMRGSGEAMGSAFASAGVAAKKSAAARAVARWAAMVKVAIVSED